VAIRAKNDQIGGHMLAAAFPRVNMMKINVGRVSASRNSASMARLNKQLPSNFGWNRWALRHNR
jgi:hypothetical protein